MSLDIRDELFKQLHDKEITAAITAERAGCLANSSKAQAKAQELGLSVDYWLEEGSFVEAGEKLMLVRGTPKQVAQAEEVLIGIMSLASGIATAARQAVEAAGGKVKIVAGAWKKMPPELKEMVRQAVTLGGACFRITEPPFLYLDKNFVRIFGGISATMAATAHFPEMTKCIQLKGETKNIAFEAADAVLGGAKIVMVDSGRVSDAVKVIEHLKKLQLREQVQVAFGGGIKIAEIPMLAEQQIDILDIGLQILNAPLLDMKMDVINWQQEQENPLNANLFRKTELRIEGIHLEKANLNQLAEIVAQALALTKEEVLVIDVQEPVVTLDILRKTVDLQKIAGKEKVILEKLATLENVRLDEGCCIHSEGILGLIGIQPERVENTLRSANELARSIEQKVRQRVMVFPTGTELIKGHVKDTNSPLIQEMLATRGFQVQIGKVLDDDTRFIYQNMLTALADGHGTIITTGGTGAEGKDCTIEAVLLLDPKAQTPYTVKFQKGTGRHVKEGVRIAVGEVDGCLLISLPGPHDEVKAVMEVIAELLENYPGKAELAEAIANCLRTILAKKVNNGHGNYQHG